MKMRPSNHVLYQGSLAICIWRARWDIGFLVVDTDTAVASLFIISRKVTVLQSWSGI